VAEWKRTVRASAYLLFSLTVVCSQQNCWLVNILL
jgi:hypothetical protein